MSEEYKIPEGLYYTEDQEWARLESDGTVTVGVTDYAQKQLHEIVYVELPGVGDDAELGAVIGALESVKAVSDMNSPVGGSVTEVNEDLLDSPELINESPYREGWIAKLEPSDWEEDKVHLMDAGAYRKHVAEQAH
ncbi:glycine cleavage system protein GcvH [Candidatus Bathyarchaeota archaeon]|nr:glycine cleavage system protein GcvH [Candidatus Bathyarchaeota archaeon]